MPVIALLALAADPVPAPQAFGNWAVACDNVKRCQAVAMLPAARDGDRMAPLVITRDPGPAGGVTIAITPEGVAGRATLLIDGKPVAPTTLFETGVRLTGSEAEGLARAMAGGRALELRDYRGKRIAGWSLAGASATLRWIDAQQGRAGTLTALVARGTRPVTAVPRAIPLPTVPALRALKGSTNFSDALAKPIVDAEMCETEPGQGVAGSAARLDAKTTLVLISCGKGAYNDNQLVYILRGGKLLPAPFDYVPDGTNGPEGPPDIVNGDWDEKRNVLTHGQLGRGLGDCGIEQEWVWDGTRFRMILKRALNDCRGSTEWPVTYRATPAWR